MSTEFHGTTILSIRKDNKVVMIGDGQVTMGNAVVVKSTAQKVKRLSGGKIISGFAGSTADAFTLFERLESKLEAHPGQLLRACVELAKDWRTDKFLRRLEAMMIVADARGTFILNGAGDVIEPEDSVAAIGSGGNYALAAAKALVVHASDLDAFQIAEASMKIAAKICVFTNENFTVEVIDCTSKECS
ncbi:ATP-dependent protease subunit HslV [Neorickettsia findlayensis]|uniref:ATP-dependent protease subunit HslV n=1 Tax=Neorickettsia findlayensis TaxID=2686014 RepID=A0A6P1G944_9RICK|nr:ATP-dependent protease subunit HslV [Neorickettsia findlayensis]QHD64976.1 ATP-dependent protease subunit HslV [Neorickettsia findlayensis]